MRKRWFAALAAAAGLVVVVAVVGALTVPAPAQPGAPLVAQGAPAPGVPQGPGGPGYAPGYRYPGYGPGFGPGYRMRVDPRFGGRGVGPGAGIVAGAFALHMLARFLLLIALLVIAWKVITSRSLWGRPDGAVQVIRERFARGEIDEEEYRKRLAALS